MRSRAAAALSLALGVLSAAPRVARADAPAPAAEKRTRAKPLGDVSVPYPDGAKGDARVVLEVVVNKDGTVRSAKAIEGPEPFASAAASAALSFRFEPATENGARVSSKVLLESLFRAPAAPKPEPEPEPDPKRPLPGPRAAVEPPPPIEVNVVGVKRPPPGGSSLSRAEVRMLPGAFGDAFRAVEILPGVTPLASGVPYFYVRGAPPGNVGYFLDGIKVPLLYHIGLGPSVLHPGLVDKVDLFPGGYPSQFGRYAGGIVSGTTRAPSDKPRAEALVRAIDAGALVEAPLDGGKESALAGGRYSYTSAVLGLLAPDVRLEYWDWQARASARLGPNDRVTVLGFGAFDFMGQKDEAGVERTVFNTEFHRVDLRWDSRWDKGSLRHAVLLGFDKTGFDGGRATRSLTVGSRTLVTLRPEERVTVRAGVDALYESFDVQLRDFASNTFAGLFPSREDLSVALFAEVEAKVTRRFDVTVGVRADLYSSQGATAAAVDPRLSFRLHLDDRVRLYSAMGLASQPPGFVAPGPGFSVGGLKGGLQRATQIGTGIEASLPLGFEARLTVFHVGSFEMTDPLGTGGLSFVGDSGGPTKLDQRWMGSAYGFEAFLQRRLANHVGGILSYTISRAERFSGALRFPSQFDRSHVLNAALQFDFTRGFSAGIRGMLYTGTPAWPPGQILAYDRRLPPFFRLDWRFEKRFTIGKNGFVSLIAEVQNTLLSQEVLGLSCAPGAPACEEQKIGPVTIPSLGVEGGI